MYVCIDIYIDMWVHSLKVFYKLRSERYFNAFRRIALENKIDLMEIRKSFYNTRNLSAFCITVMKLQHEQITKLFSLTSLTRKLNVILY